MRVMRVVLGLVLSIALGWTQDALSEARRLERAGDAAQAERVLRAAAEEPGASLETLAACAEFLDARGNPDAQSFYVRLLSAEGRPDAGARRSAAARRLVLLSLEAGEVAEASRYLQSYRELGGGDWPKAALSPPAPETPAFTAEIPGPFESFRRMAAISEDVAPAGVLPALARNVVTNGYQAGGGKEGLV